MVGAAAGLDLSRAEAVGSGRACQRPRTSSVAPAFRAKWLWQENWLFFKFLAIIVALGGASLAAEERGAAKPRGRGLGQRNIDCQRVLHSDCS